MTSPTDAPSVHLIVRRTIRATPERLFEASTEPAQVQQWWGPADVHCSAAEIDLRVGGQYRIANQLPDGRVLWILGEFEEISPPHKLVYTWRLDPPGAERRERVTVRFEPRGQDTEVIIVHERIVDHVSRAMHEHGWIGCLEGLEQFLAEHVSGSRAP